jgi:hypothetical protein
MLSPPGVRERIPGETYMKTATACVEFIDRNLITLDLQLIEFSAREIDS